MLAKIKSFLEKILPKGLDYKLENDFMSFVKQGEVFRPNKLQHGSGGFDDTVVNDITLIHKSNPIGWIKRIGYTNNSDTLIVKHFAIDSQQVRKHYGKGMLKGFAKAIKRDFPHINFIDFEQAFQPGMTPEKEAGYFRFFQRQGMYETEKDVYRYDI